ncbi:triose-phosphate isomerase [Natranaerobius trueperi]|uniref:Triosephosphate isomerase n=1 Tax=Natranaerobius trueperi TaxID=759412 RepID=A0A226BXN5_9FIRM|nr:triose-phosphate isomerase [Natranaerobius trueperi]OWZ83793.1 triose-phosphate isomerase [Natranaerobius trueperi]
MARTIIAGNWKMNHGPKETQQFLSNLSDKYFDKPNVEAVVCPPFISLPIFQEKVPKWLSSGAQNMYFEESGAFTGEISPKMLADLGVKYVIIGHSERRGLFNEKDDDVNKKVRIALKYGLIPIICVGETENERDNNKTFEVVERQVKKAICDTVKETLKCLVFAYEPVWAIGTGKASSGKDAEEVCEKIRGVLSSMGDLNQANEIPILYGGSVKPENLEEYLSQPNINGALVGGKSLDANSFSELLDLAGGYLND